MSLVTAAHFVGHAGPFGFGGFPWFAVIIPIFWLLVIGLLVTLFVRGRRRGYPGPWGAGGPGQWGPGAAGGPGTAGARVSAEHILAERFARGDIDEVDYRARLEVLRAGGVTPPQG